MITRLTLSNLKSVTRTFELGPITLICGPNESGKTAVIDGLKLSFLGFHPRLGKPMKATWDLASPGATMMTVATNERTISWKKKSNGSIVVEGLDGLGDVPSVMLDLQEWLALSGPERVRYVIEHSGTVLGDSLTEVDRLLKLNPRISNEASKLDRTDSAKFLRLVMTLAKANRQEAQVELTTIQGAVNQVLLSNEKPPENPEKELKAVQAELEKAQALVNQTIGKRQSLQAALARDLQKLSKHGPPPEMVKVEIASLASEVEAFTADYKKLEQSMGEIRSKLNPSLIAVKRAEHQRLVERNASLDDEGCCPTCGAPVDHGDIEEWRREVLSKEVEVEELELQQQELSGQEDELAAEIRDLSFRITTKNKQRDSARVDLDKFAVTARERVAAEERSKQLQKELDAIPEPDAAVIQPWITQRDELLAKQREWLAWKGQERARTTALEQKATFNTALENSKALIVAIKASEDGLLQRVMQPLLDRCNVLVVPVLGRPLEYRDDRFYVGPAVLDTLSGSQEAVVFAGLQLSLSHLIKERILVLDELKNFDANRLELLLVTIEKLIADGTISQMVGVLPGEPPVSKVEMTIIKM